MDGSHENVALWSRILQCVQVERPHPCQQIHIVCPLKGTSSGLVPFEDLPEDVEGNDDGCCEICLEESLDTAGGVTANGLLGER